jgi:membrane associated rhomboid family serine protease
MMQSLPPVTRALLLINIGVFILQKLTGDLLLVYFALWPLGDPRVAEMGGAAIQLGFEPWQLLTYAFLHGNVPHIAFNMLALYMFGGPLERLWGSKAFSLYYTMSVFGAALAQLLVMGAVPHGAPFYPTVGASGGVFGLLLGFGMMFPRQQIMLLIPPIPMPAWLLVSLYGALELFMGLVSSQRGVGIAHFAHLGGMVTGFIMIQYWRAHLPIRPRRRLMR